MVHDPLEPPVSSPDNFRMATDLQDNPDAGQGGFIVKIVLMTKSCFFGHQKWAFKIGQKWSINAKYSFKKLT